MEKEEMISYQITPLGAGMGAQQMSLMMSLLCWEYFDNPNISVSDLIEKLKKKTEMFIEIAEGNLDVSEMSSNELEQIREMTDNQYRVWIERKVL